MTTRRNFLAALAAGGLGSVAASATASLGVPLIQAGGKQDRYSVCTIDDLIAWCERSTPFVAMLTKQAHRPIITSVKEMTGRDIRRYGVPQDFCDAAIMLFEASAETPCLLVDLWRPTVHQKLLISEDESTAGVVWNNGKGEPCIALALSTKIVWRDPSGRFAELPVSWFYPKAGVKFTHYKVRT